jgi:hypothetical protein
MDCTRAHSVALLRDLGGAQALRRAKGEIGIQVELRTVLLEAQAYSACIAAMVTVVAAATNP